MPEATTNSAPTEAEPQDARQSDTASQTPLKRTPLYDVHAALGAKIVPFAGFEMPVQYPTGITAEHKAVREKAGLFDVSHMGEFMVRGPQAVDFVSYVARTEPSSTTVSSIAPKIG
jgi:aminomethyltransferase